MKRLPLILGLTFSVFLTGCGEEEKSSDRSEKRGRFQSTDGAMASLPQKKVEPPPVPEPEPEPVPGEIYANPGMLEFGTIYVRFEAPGQPGLGKREKRSLSLIHKGETPVRITQILSSRTDIYQIEGDCMGAQLQPRSRSCNIQINFEPGSVTRPGRYDAQLTAIYDNGSSGQIAVKTEVRAMPAIKKPAPAPKPFVKTGPTRREMVLIARYGGRPQGLKKPLPIPAAANDPADRFVMSEQDYEEKLKEGRVNFTYPLERERMVPKHRAVPAVLNHAVNSQLEGRFSAVISRHVYGPDGRYVLLPKWTIINGFHGRLNKEGDTRLPVVINEIIRPDGAKITLQASGADQMGRAGLVGIVDNQLWERFGSAFLVGTINVLGAFAAGDGADPRVQAAQAQAAETLSDIGNRMLENQVNLAPITSIPGGARIHVVLDEDLWFPEPRRILAGRPDSLAKASGFDAYGYK